MKLLKPFAAAALALSVFINQPAAAQDAKAKGILTAVSAKVKALKSLKANFSLKMMNSAGKVSQNKTGSFSMKGDKYRISLGSQEIFCDGRTVWTYMKDANEVQVTAFNPAEQSISPQKLFAGSYEREYNYTYAGPSNAGDVISLTPKAAGGQFSKVDLTVSKGSTIAGGTMYQKTGGKTVYTVSGFTPNPVVADNVFVFDAKNYPGVEVVDLR